MALETWGNLKARQLEQRNALIKRAIKHCDGNRKRAADLIGLDVGTMHKHIREQGIDVVEPKHWRHQALKGEE
ncbi:MAG: helix-turn-helix domain-containing protein [Pseudomonadota bacterium]